MIVYWDLVALWNFLLDYLLLLCAARLAGCSPGRGRLALAALLGAAYAVAQFLLPAPRLLAPLALLAVCAAAFAGTGRGVKLSLLFLLLACALGGAVLLLGGAFGHMAALTRGVFRAELPWGVFLLAAGCSYLLLGLVFRDGARHGRAALLRARIEYGGHAVTLTLFRDTGNTLRDPRTGEGVPVVYWGALRPLFPGRPGAPPADEPPFTGLPFHAVGVEDGRLPAFRCDALTADGKAMGARLIAISAAPLSDGGGFQGLWGEEPEGWEEQ